MLSEKYQKFLQNNFLPNVQPPSLDLSAEGWKLLVKENLSPIIEKELDMTQIDDFVWATEYKNGMRKMLSFFRINDAYATFKWGWKFEFIPKCSGSKVVWAKTDKSIYTHIYEISPYFYNTGKVKREDRKKVVMTRYEIDINNIGKGLEDKIKHHQEVFYFLLPEIKKYYQSTETMEQVLNKIDENLNHWYFSFINPNLKIVRVFIEYHLGLHEKAINDLEAIEFLSSDIKNQYRKRLLSLK